MVSVLPVKEPLRGSWLRFQLYQSRERSDGARAIGPGQSNRLSTDNDSNGPRFITVGRYHLNVKRVNVKRALPKAVLSLVALAALVYIGDDLSLRLQIPKRPQFGTVHIQPYLAVPRKDGRIEYMLDDPVDQPCVHSLFPHKGDSPCWYLERQRNKRVNM